MELESKLNVFFLYTEKKSIFGASIPGSWHLSKNENIFV